MKLSTRSRYGTRLILDIALHCKDGPVRISESAARQRISVKYLERIVQILKNAGFIESKRGQRGGHVLARPVEEITVGSIIRALEGDDTLVECARETRACDSSASCLARMVWQKASQAMFKALDEITIAELVRLSGKGAHSDCSGPDLPGS